MTGPQVGITFNGSSVGAVTAAERTAAAIGSVRSEASTLSPSLRTVDQDLGKVSRGALAGTGIFSGLGRSVAFASGAFLGGYGLLAALRGAATELSTQVQLNAQVRAELRSTGGVAGVTARMIDGLAEAEMRKTGADKQQIKQAEIMLLRYTNVRDVAGQGNDVFKRATQASLDLATALGTNASDAATTLGKALQDPITGVTQLRRAHVALTVQEIAHIKQLAQEGKVLEAQKAILDAVTRSYGGTAKAVSNVAPWTRLRSSLMELSANAIKPLLPDIDSLIGRIQGWADGLAHNRAEQERLKTDVEEGAHAIGDAAKAVQTIAGVMGGWGHVLETIVAVKLATTVTGWTTALGRLSGGLGSAAGGGGAVGRSGALLANLKSLAAIGAMTVGVDLLFKSSGDKGGKGFFESLFGAGLVGGALGFQVGGPWGAGLGLAIGVSADIFEHLIHGGALSASSVAPDVFKGKNPYPVGTSDYANWQAGATGARPPGDWRKGEQTHAYKQGVRANAQAMKAGGAGAVVAAAEYYGTGQGAGIYGSTPTDAGRVLDCSAYVYEVFTRAGFKDFPKNSETQWATDYGPNWASQQVGVGEASPGDVVFYNVPGGEGAYPNHVGIVVKGRGQTAMVMQYTRTGQGSHVYSIIVQYPIQGVKRYAKVAHPSDAGGGARSPDTGPVKGKSTVHTITGSNLLPEDLRNQISVAAGHVTTAKTPAIAERWLRTELGDLETARKLLEEKLRSAHGKQKAAIEQELRSVDAEIARVQHGIATEAAKLARTAAQIAAKAAVNAISKIERMSVGPEQALKLAEAAGEPASVILADQQGLLAAYRAEAARLKTRLKHASGEARSKFKTALDNIDQAINGTIDGIVGTLQSIYQAAQGKVSTAAGQVERDVISQFEQQTQSYIDTTLAPQYFQGVDPTTGLPRQTPAEAQLAAMQAADTQRSLQEALSQAEQQLAKDQAAAGPASGGAAVVSVDGMIVSGSGGSDVLSQDEQAIQTAQRAIDENNLAIEATAERAAADAAYAAAVQTYTTARNLEEDKLTNALDGWANGLTDGTSTLGDLTGIAADFGVTLTGITDPNTGIGYDFSVLSGAAQDAATALNNLTAAAGGTVSGGVAGGNYGGGGVPVGGRGGSGIVGMAFGGRVPGPLHVNRDSVPALLMPGETVIDRRLTAALEQVFLGGGGSARLVAGDVYMDSYKVGRTVARPVSDAQRRQISYTLQRS